MILFSTPTWMFVLGGWVMDCSWFTNSIILNLLLCGCWFLAAGFWILWLSMCSLSYLSHSISRNMSFYLHPHSCSLCYCNSDIGCFRSLSNHCSLHLGCSPISCSYLHHLFPQGAKIMSGTEVIWSLVYDLLIQGSCILVIYVTGSNVPYWKLYFYSTENIVLIGTYLLSHFSPFLLTEYQCFYFLSELKVTIC